MNGYLAGLAARGRGVADVARARRTPSFRPRTGRSLPLDAEVVVTGARAALGAPAAPRADPDRRDPVALEDPVAALPATGATAPPGDARMTAWQVARPAPAPLLVPASGPSPATAIAADRPPREAAVPPQRPAPPPRASASVPAVARSPLEPAPTRPLAPGADPGPAATPAPALRARPVARPLPGPRSAAPAPAPPIEVRIGRVEVRAPRPATPPKPGPPRAVRASREAPARAGFGELAAARRFVDRIAR